ncbi:MAG: OFA family MFS transporter [Desulfotomaculaceae bacterium]|nr:OFA family MFS transporter [Desulfotomaculaceae bacterium]
MGNQNKGWLVTWCAVGINLALGMLYAWSVFAAALVKDFGFTKTEAALPYTVALAMMALLTVPGGRVQDRLGPRICTTIGGILAGGGLIIAGFTNSITALVIAFGVISGAGIGIGYAATTPAAVKWFPPQKRGLISGLVVAGVGLAPVYVAPMTQFFINSYGVFKAFWLEGIIFLIAIVILSQFMSVPASPAAAPAQGAGPATGAKREYSPGEMLRTHQFWLMYVMYGCGAVAGLMIIGHLAIIANLQAGIQWAFVFVSLLAIFNAGGRIIGGVLSDKIGRNQTLLLMFALQAVNMLFFSSYNTTTLLILGIGIAGIAYGSLLAIFPPITFDYFGLKNGGVNYGCLFTAWGIAGVVGPIMAGKIIDATQSYSQAYLVAAGLLVLSAILVLFLKAPKTVELDSSIKA